MTKKKSDKIKTASKKHKKLSSRQALAKFANSDLKPKKKPKSKLAETSIAKQAHKKHQLKDISSTADAEVAKSTEIGDGKDSLKFANTDATSWRKMTEDAAAPVTPLTNVLEPTKPARLFSDTSSSILMNASFLLAIATGIAILFAVVMVLLPGGQDAVPAMGGVLQATAPFKTAQIVFFLDILFPITFGAGFALFTTAFQTRGNRPVVRLILTALLFVVLADFSENALVFKALTGGETYAVQWPLTVIKYAMLGVSAVLLSSIMFVKGTIGLVAMLFLRFVFPISIAALLAGIGGRMGSDIVGATFPLGLLLLAFYANMLASYKTEV